MNYPTPTEFAARFGPGKQIAGGFLVRCPAHKDTDQSLAVTEEGGRTLFYCHAGCSQTKVIAKLTELNFLQANGNGNGGFAHTTPRDPKSARPAAAKPKDSPWIPQLPVPDNAPPPVFRHWQNGESTAQWAYLDAQSRLLFYTCRFDDGAGGKSVLPMCFVKNKATGVSRWTWCAPTKTDRPLYGLEELAARPEADVLVVEGEKACEAAKRLLPDFVVVTWMGGSKAAPQTDWLPLAGRNVCIWPDNDKAGLRVARILYGLLNYGVGAKSVVVCAGFRQNPALGAPIRALLQSTKGFDAADAELAGWDAAATQEFLNSVKITVSRVRVSKNLAAKSKKSGNLPQKSGGKNLENATPPDFSKAVPGFLRPEIAAPPVENLENEGPEGVKNLETEVQKSGSAATPPDFPTAPASDLQIFPIADSSTAAIVPPGTPAATTKTLPKKLIALGYDHDQYFYLSEESRQVIHLSAGNHKKLQLLSLVSDTLFWAMTAPKRSPQGAIIGVEWDEAARWMMEECKKAGPFSNEHVRGRGAWFDEGKVVLHLGNRLIIDGEEHPLLTRPGKYVYEAAERLAVHTPNAMDDVEAGKVLLVCRTLNWKQRIHGMMLAGWVALAPICGALQWRPHIWLSGAAGSGKTWVMECLIAALIQDFALYLEAGTTEAGMRQALHNDALPVIFDEAEGEDQHGHARIQNFLRTVRAASSRTRARLAKGSISGQAQYFDTRSMFCLASIGVSLEKNADKSRVSVLELGPGRKGEEFQALQEAVKDFTREFSHRLFARTVSLIPVIRDNAALLAREAAVVMDSQRLGDQYGALLAGAWSLQSSERMTEEEARAFIRQYDWVASEEIQDVQDKDEDLCLQRVLGTSIRIDSHGKALSRTLGELVAIVSWGRGPFENVNPNNVRWITVKEADEQLRRMGILVDRTDEFLYIANAHHEISKLLAGTSWASGYGRTLRRISGSGFAGQRVFTSGSRFRSIAIPLSALQGMVAEEVVEEDGPPKW